MASWRRYCNPKKRTIGFALCEKNDADPLPLSYHPFQSSMRYAGWYTPRLSQTGQHRPETFVKKQVSILNSIMAIDSFGRVRCAHHCAWNAPYARCNSSALISEMTNYRQMPNPPKHSVRFNPLGVLYVGWVARQMPFLRLRPQDVNSIHAKQKQTVAKRLAGRAQRQEWN